MNDIVTETARLAEEVAGDEGLEVVEVEYFREGAIWILRVYIDRLGATGDGKEGGVTFADCTLVTRQLAGLLDVNDLIPNAYRLEVSSPGADRPLTKAAHFERFAGRKAKVKMARSLEGRRNFQGRIDGFEEGCILLAIAEDDKVHRLPLADLGKCRLEPEF